MAAEKGRVFMPFGVMGGHYQAMGHAHLLAKLFDHRLDLQTAIDLPRLFPLAGNERRRNGAALARPARRGARSARLRDPSGRLTDRRRSGDLHRLGARNAARRFGSAQGRLRARLLIGLPPGRFRERAEVYSDAQVQPRSFLRRRRSISMAHTNAKDRNDPERPIVRPKPRDCNPTWGLRDLEAVTAIARSGRILDSDDHRDAREQSRRGVPPDLIETVRWRAAGERPPRAPKFSDTLDRTEASRTIVGVGLFNLGLVFITKGPRATTASCVDDRPRAEPGKGLSIARIATSDAFPLSPPVSQATSPAVTSLASRR